MGRSYPRRPDLAASAPTREGPPPGGAPPVRRGSSGYGDGATVVAGGPVSEPKRLPRRPPFESAVIRRLTGLRSTIKPSRFRCRGPSCRVRTWQIRCSLPVLAIRHLRENVAFAVNGCVTVVGVPVSGVYVAVTVP